MINGEDEFVAVSSFADGTVGAVAPKRLFFSHDQGKSWSEVAYPHYVTGLYNLTQVPDGSLWLATREGALHSVDGGKTWEHVLGGLPARNVYAVRYDASAQRLLATAQHTHGVFESRDGGKTWQRTPDTGVSIRAAMNFQGRLLVASSYNGLLLQQGAGASASAETANVTGSSAGSAAQQ
jgi:photosystem II stability/assembly factor-like uncharacterized protein